MVLRGDPSWSKTSASFKSILKDGKGFYLAYTELNADQCGEEGNSPIIEEILMEYKENFWEPRVTSP